MKKTCTLLTIAVAMLVSSCLQYDRNEGLQLTKALKVTVSVDDVETAGTKSAVTAQDVSAENFNIWIYDDKGLVCDGYFTDADNIKVDRLTVGTTYHVRAVANVGAMSPPVTLAAADALFFDWDISGLNSLAGVPMTYKDSFTLAITSALNIHFRRAVAKYTFVIDQSGFTGTYTIRSLRLCNAPSKVLAFAESKIDGSSITATDGDYATDADLTKLNQGLGVQFFIYENNQGELLSGNTDPWKKEFENYNTEKASYASKCTYLEVTGDYVTSGITVEDLTYRIYLGKNATTNFDVTRNTAYTVILAPQDATVLDDGLISWKVEKGEITDTRGLSFSPASIDVPSMGQATATVVPTPAALEYVLEAGDNFTAAGLTFEQAGNSVIVRSGSIVPVETSAKLIARTTDGSLRKALPVTVLPPTVESVTVSPADGWEIAIGADKQFTATATMFDGTVQDVTSSAKWTTTTTSTLTKESTAGLFSGKAAGSATIKAEYEGKTAISTGTVKDDVYSYRVVLSGSSVAVSAGKTAEVTPKVMYYVTKNGVEDSGTDVTSSAVLKSKDTGIATVSGTTVTGVSVGNTKLYAEYSNGSQTISSDKVSGGSYIDVTVSDKSVDGYEYNDPIFELSYSDVGAGGSAATPTLTYSQTATIIWSDGSTEENVVIAAAGSSIPSGVTVTWGGSAKNGSGGSINSSNGNVTAKNRGINDYSRGVVFTATASATINGKPGSTSKDVYQTANTITNNNVSLSNSSLDAGKTCTATYNGVWKSGSAVTGYWSSDNSSVASVSGTSKTATVTAKGAGNTWINFNPDGGDQCYQRISVTGPTITKTETETGTENRNNEWDADQWVKINNKTSDTKSVGAASGSVTVTATAGYVHHVQPQKHTRTRNKYTWSDGSVTYGDWSSWSEWSNNGSASTSDRSATPTLSSSATWIETNGSYGANVSTSSRTATITASYGGESATLTVTQGANQQTGSTTETEEKTQKVESDFDYWVKINGETSSSVNVSAAAGSVTVNATAGYTHKVQPQKSTRIRTKYTWQVGDPTYSEWSEWSDWFNDGNATTSDKSATPTLNSSDTWLATSGSYGANASKSSRTATITASYGSASATLTVTQAKPDSYEIDVE